MLNENIGGKGFFLISANRRRIVFQARENIFYKEYEKQSNNCVFIQTGVLLSII